jgi:hypothetical protein
LAVNTGPDDLPRSLWGEGLRRRKRKEGRKVRRREEINGERKGMPAFSHHVIPTTSQSKRGERRERECAKP